MSKETREIAERIRIDIFAYENLPINPLAKDSLEEISWIEKALDAEREKALREVVEICHKNCSWTSEKEILALIEKK